jgi:hypothetical protein
MNQNQRPPHAAHAVTTTRVCSWGWTPRGLTRSVTTEALFACPANGRARARKAAWSSCQGCGKTCHLRSADALHSFLLSVEREAQG